MHGRTLYEVYKRPSQAKINAWENIERDIKERKGFSVQVYGNSYAFSVYYNYIDDKERWHNVKVTHVNETDKIVYRRCNIIAQYNTSAFSAWVILDAIYGVNDKIVSGYLYNNHIENVRTTKVHTSAFGEAYIIRNKQRLYLDNFLRIDYNK